MTPHQLRDALNQHLAKKGLAAVDGANAHEIHGLRVAIGFDVPRVLCEWLAVCRGRVVELPSVSCLYGTDREFNAAEHRDLHGIQAGWVPVAGDGCGSCYCVVCGATPEDAAPVIFVDHDGAPPYVAASGLFKFLEFVLAEPEFDEDSDYLQVWFDRERQLVEDPEAAGVKGFRFGWEVE